MKAIYDFMKSGFKLKALLFVVILLATINQLEAQPITVSNNSPICPTKMLTLDAFGAPVTGTNTWVWMGPGGTWSSTTVTSPGIQDQSIGVLFGTSGVTAGVYSLTVTNSGGGTYTATTTVYDAASAAATPSPVCISGLINLAGGPSPNAGYPLTYGWTGTGGTIAGTALQNTTVNAWGTAGSYSYTLTVTNAATGCTFSATTSNVTVEPLPTISLTSGTSTPTFCVNTLIPADIVYTIGGSATGAGVTGLPTGMSGTFSGTSFTITGTPSVAGTFGYTVTTTGGSCAGVASTGTITVQTLPTLTLSSAAGTDNQDICVNTAVTDVVFTIGGTATGASLTGTLPGGLSGTFSGTTYTISGTATETGTFTYTVTTTGGCSPAASLNGSIAVHVVPTISLTSGSSTPTICVNTTLTSIVYTVNTPVTDVTMTGLFPAGVSGTYSSTAKTYTISGTPTASGTFTYTLTTVSLGCTAATTTGSITVEAVPVITKTSPSCTLAHVCPIGTYTPFTYTLSGGATNATVTGLPGGYAGTLSGTTYIISGSTSSPTGTYNFTVTTTGTTACSAATATGTIEVVTFPTVSLDAGTATQTICIGSPITPIEYSVTNGITNYDCGASTHPITVTGLPAGVTGTVSGTTLTISGTPTGSGISNFMVSGIGPCAASSSSSTGTITVDALPTISLSSGSNNQTICISSPMTPVVYTLGGSATGASTSGLPGGISGTLSGTTYTISGTSTGTGTFNYTVTTSGGTCTPTTATGTITVDALPTLLLASAPGTNSQTICNFLPITDIAYTVGGGATGATVSGLPTGLSGSYSSPTFTISGTLNTATPGVYNYTVTSTGGTCSATTATGTITVLDSPVSTLTGASNVCVGNTTKLTVAGTWFSVTWSSSVPAVATVAGDGYVTGVTPGSTIISAIIYNGICYRTFTQTVTVDAIPTITLSSGSAVQNVCINTAIGNVLYTIGGSATGVTPTGLPTGVSGTLSGTTYTLSGTPSVAGTYNYLLTTSGGTCTPATTTGTITVTNVHTLSHTSGSTSQLVCINTAITPIVYTIGGSATNATFTGPAGLSGTLSGTTYTISGSPSVAGGSQTYTVTTTGAPCSSLTATGTISVDALPTVTASPGPATQSVCLGSAMTQVIFTLGGSAPSYTATMTGLDPGMGATQSGTIVEVHGTPSAAGVYTLQVSTGGVCSAVSATATVTVDPLPTISLTSANNIQTKCINTAIDNITYNVGGSATGAGAVGLPAGVTGTFSGTTFTISGTPTADGTFNYTVTTTGGACTGVTATGTLTITPAPTVVHSSGPISQTKCNFTAIDVVTFTIGGSATGATVTNLPAGVSYTVSGTTVTIIGTPNTPTSTGTYIYVVTTSGGICAAATTTGTIVVNEAPITTVTGASNVCVGSSTQLTAPGESWWTATWNTSNGAIATISSTGLVTGVAAGTVTISVTIDNGTCIRTFYHPMTVDGLQTISWYSGSTAQTVCINNAIAAITYNTGGSVTGATVSGLPAGVTGTYSSTANTVVISGTPTASGIFNYTVTTSGICAPAVTATGTINVDAVPTANLTSGAGTNIQTICLNTAVTNINYSIGGAATGAGVTGLPGGLSGAYSSGVFTISGTATEVGTFNYTVTTSGGVCTAATKTGTITVTDLPVVTLSSGSNNQTLCNYTPISTIVYSISGTATGAGVTGLPTGVSGTFTGTTLTITGTPSVSGTFIYTVTTTGGVCAGATATGTINVDAAPELTISGSNTVCIGSTTLLTATGTWNWATWTSLNPAIATVSPAGLVTGVSVGTTTITLTVNNGPCTRVFYHAMTVQALPTIALTSGVGTDAQTLCINTPLTNIVYAIGGSATGATLTGSLPAGVTGTYSGTNFIISGTPTASGAFNYTVTTTGGCSPAVSANGSITVEAVPTITLTSAAGTNAQTKCINTAITNITYAIGGAATGANVSGLPTGVSGAYAAGVVTISGAPSVLGNFTYTVTTTGGSCVAATTTGTINVVDVPTISLTSAPGSNIQTLCINTALTPVTYSVGGTATGASASGLPAGVTGTYSASVFTISGTPTASGTFNYTVTTSGSLCTAVTATGTITVQDVPTITLSSGPVAQTVCINNPVTSVVYAIGGAATGANVTGLPTGVNGVYAGGSVTISGTPTVTGPFVYTITTTGGACTAATTTGSITVDAVPTISLTSGTGTNIQTVCINNPITTITYSVGGTGTGASVVGLPAGVSGTFSGTVFTISGTPTASGTFNYTVTTSGTGVCANATATGTITVQAVPTVSLTSGPITQTVCVNTPITPVIFTIGGSATGASASGLPTGVSGTFTGTTLTISGTPSATGPFVFTVTTSGGVCTAATTSATINVDVLPTITLTSGNNNQTLCSHNAITNITYNIGGSATGAGVTGLPTGVTGAYSAGVFTISGTPTVHGTFVYVVTTTGGTCAGASASGTLTVNESPESTISGPTQVCIGSTAQLAATGSWISALWQSVTPSIATVSASGLVTGITAGTTTITLTLYNGTCYRTFYYPMTVLAMPTISLTSGNNVQTVCINNAVANIVYNTGGSATGATVSGLPSGLSGNYSGGVYTISGTPTVSGVFNYTVTTTGPCSPAATATGTINVDAAPTITLTSGAGTNLQTVCINSPITFITYTTGGSATGVAVSGLPAGITGNYTAGILTLSGTPTASGTFNYTIATTGGVCTAATATGTITVQPVPTITLSSGSNVQSLCINTAVGSIVYTVGGSATGASVSGLPTGVTGAFAGSSFTISGTPTVSGVFNYTVTTSGGVCAPVTATGTITVIALPTVTLTSANNIQNVCINGAIGNILYNVGGSATGASASGLPTGVTGSYAAGVFTISGSPSVAGTYNYTVTTSGGGCGTATATGTISVDALQTIALASGPAVQTLCNLTPITNVVYNVGGSATGATATGLPAGVTGFYSAGVFTISGTPSVAGTFNFTVSTVGGVCAPASATGTITVNALPVTTITGGSSVCVNSMVTLSATGTWVNTLWVSSHPAVATISPVGVVTGVSQGTTTITLTVFDGTCYNSFTHPMTVYPLQTIALTSASANVAVCQNAMMTPITYAIGGSANNASATGLPAGVTGVYNAGVFTISGTPTDVPGAYPYTVTTSGPNCDPVTANGIITVNELPTIALASGSPVVAVCQNAAITNIVYNVGGSATGAGVTGLPAGLTGSYLAGVFTISGAPTATPGVYPFTVTTTGGLCGGASATGTVTVNMLPTVTLTTASGTDNQTITLGTPIANIGYTVGGSATGAGVIGLPAGVNSSFSGGVLTISGQPTVLGTYVYTVTTTGGLCGGATATGSITVNPVTGTINGYVQYNNAFLTGLNNVQVHLQTPAGVTLQTVATTNDGVGAKGYYQFTGIADGNYRITATFPTGIWGGNNGTDALIIELTTVGQWTLTGLPRSIGDVNNSKSITSVDALYIKERLTGGISSYPTGDWGFDTNYFAHVSTSVVNVLGMCYGDVNGSYTSPMKNTAQVTDGEQQQIVVNKPFNYELRSSQATELGAVTLYMNYDPEIFTVEKVNSAVDGMKYRIEEGRVTIVWASINPMRLDENESVLSMQIVAKKELTEATQIFTISQGTEFADPNANRIENYNLKLSKVITPATLTNFFMYNYPNPVRTSTEIVYSVPEDGKVTLVLTNMYGQTLRTLVNEVKEAGTYNVKVDLTDGNLQSGVYLYRIEITGATENYTKTNKMVLSR